MKTVFKTILTVSLIAISSFALAQDVIITKEDFNQFDCVKTPILEDVRMNGNIIYYKNKPVKNQDLREILQKTYNPSYEKFVSGTKATKAGQALLITGAAVGITGMLLGGGNVNAAGDDAIVAVGIAMCIIGTSEIITSIPLLSVGYSKKSRAKREFVRHCLTFQPEKTEKQLDYPRFDFNVKSNGVGLAWTF